MLYQSLLFAVSLIRLSSQAPLVDLAKRSYSNGPVITANFPDPGFIYAQGTYYAFATNNGQQNVPLATSPDFNAWTLTGQDALPTVPSWSTGAIWAPDVIELVRSRVGFAYCPACTNHDQADGSYVMYFAGASSQDPNKHCVGVATASNPAGPYTPSNTPLACPLDQGGAIDAAGYVNDDGNVYVVYKVDGNSLGGGGACGNGDGSHATPIMLQQVSPKDGITLIGNPTQILDRGPYDGPLIEAPSLVKSDGVYFLFFSSNCYNGPYYDTSYATATDIAGPYTKASGPLLVTGGDGGRLNSPGGTTVSKDGTKILFHADLNPGDSSTRQMWTGVIKISGTTVTI